MPQPLVSVIVPAYNAAGFISRCVESITSQSYPELEILLLNDGSTDDTLCCLPEACCRRQPHPCGGQAQHRRSRHPQLRPCPCPRRIHPVCGQRRSPAAGLHRKPGGCYAAQPCRPLCWLPYRMMVPRKDGGYDTREYSLLPAGVYNKVDYLWQLTGNAAAFYYGVLWNKLYRRDLIQMAHIRFEHVVYAEDQLFNTRYLQVAQRFAAIDEAAYCYIQNPQSVCHTQVSAADMLRHRSRMYHTYKELCIQLGVYDKFRLRLHGIYLSLFESPLPNGPVQKLSDAFARTHSRI